jgi:hypothetical protein
MFCFKTRNRVKELENKVGYLTRQLYNTNLNMRRVTLVMEALDRGIQTLKGPDAIPYTTVNETEEGIPEKLVWEEVDE